MVLSTNRIIQVRQNSQVQLLADWIKSLRATTTSQSTAISDPELQAQCRELSHG